MVLVSYDSAGKHSTVSSPAAGDRRVQLTLASGTAQDGVWVGAALVGAVDAGFWRPA